MKPNQEKPTRRQFIKTTALLAGSLSVMSSSARAQSPTPTKKTAKGLTLNAAGYHFKRLEALYDGRVTIEGCETEFRQMGIGDMNTHVFSGPQTLDVTEIGLHPFILAYANQDFRAYTLLPIFPLRLFRHKSIFIRTDRGISKPEDLKGKTIASPGYSSTSLTWIRGILEDEYGIRPTDVDWITSAKDSSAGIAGKISAQEQMLPKGITMKSGPAGQDESDLLVSGAADALFHAAEPRAYMEGHPKVARLFPDARLVESAHYKKTSIFPIMHAVAIKKSLLKENPWLAKATFNAYSKSKSLAYHAMAKKGWLDDMLPWYGQELENTKTLMGDNFYSYGMDDKNRKTLETLCRYSQEQGLAGRRLKVEELFDPSTLEFVEG